ncbi:hypothetical protein [Streptomyces sp. LNU-CPARS28]|uniref:hypothetical protein n=1 Tax=Streptomyces sp. LNU-CPARS28 TaxID=3137371 RepID=UPI0031369311
MNEQQRPEDFLAEFFEFEDCDSCGGGDCAHTVVVDALGNLHAACDEGGTQ